MVDGERLEFDLLFRWFVGLTIDEKVFDEALEMNPCKARFRHAYTAPGSMAASVLWRSLSRKEALIRATPIT